VILLVGIIVLIAFANSVAMKWPAC